MFASTRRGDDSKSSDPLDRLDQSIEKAKEKNLGVSGKKEEQNKGSPGGLKAGIELGTSVVVGMFIGYHLDQWLGTSPVLFFVFLLIGMAAGMLNLYRLLQEEGKEK